MRKAILASMILALALVAFGQHGKSQAGGKTAASPKPKPKPKPRTDPYLVPIPPDEILFDDLDRLLMLDLRKGWRLIDRDEFGTSVFYDKDRLTSTKGITTKQGWIKYEKRKEGVLQSYFLSLEDFDCGQKRGRTIQIVKYGKDGDSIGNTNGDQTWRVVVPDSLGERILGVICLNWPDNDELEMALANEDFRKARQLEKRGQSEDAKQWYESALTHAPKNPKITAALARLGK